MNEKFVVLGSNSFSGSHFVAHLLRRGHAVLGLSRSREVDSIYRPYAWRASSGRFEFVQVDLNDTKSLAAELTKFSPDVVVNFAAQSMVAQSWEHPEHWYRTNVVALANLTSILERLPSLERYVHVTTPEVYGSTGGWITESETFHPTTPYAISRAAGDLHLMAMFREQQFPVVFTRAANVYGPGQQLYRIVPRTLLFARLGRSLRLDGGGVSTRSFIHIADVAEATYRIAAHTPPGSTYHISTDEIVSIRDLVQSACALTGTEFDELVEIGPERPGKDDTYMLNSSRLRSELDWEPRFTLEHGLRDTLGWIDTNLGALRSAPDSYQHKE